MIGTLGEVVFETSSERIRTFDDFKRDGSARYAKHDVLGIKPIKQFIGPDLDKISFTMTLNISFGVNPKDEITKLREMKDKGEAVQLVIGGVPVGSGKYTIENLSETWTRVDNKGNLLIAKLDIQLEEYVAEISKPVVQNTSQSPNKSSSTGQKTSSSGTSVSKKNVTRIQSRDKVRLLE